jgi:hypothetical protein
MHKTQCFALRSGFLVVAVLLLPLLAAEAQLQVSNKSKHMSPTSPPTVAVPTNATLDYTGHAWECKPGYQRSGNACAVVHIPAHATLDYTGHAWECKPGYQRSGNACVAVHMPAHATLDYFGHAWECESGYRRVGDACEKMTALPETAMDGSSAVRESRVNPPQQNDAKEEIRQIQERLKQAGFDPGPLDGILGSRTLKALHRYLATR